MRKLVLMVGLALVGFACADGVGEMLIDAGQMLGDGSVPQAQGQEVTCSKSATERVDEGETSARTMTYRWAEFDVDPGATEVTNCLDGSLWPNPPIDGRTFCNRFKATWFRGTSTGFVQCGIRTDWDDDENFTDSDSPDPISITVHR